MMEIRRSQERGVAEHGWLRSFHSFSFAEYQDPKHMGFSALRVINEDRVQPGQGFGTHGHRYMEIIRYVLEGGLAHRDSMGNGSVIRPGDVQRMSAGTGVTHSEYNASERDPVHFLQIWIEPSVRGIPPSYEEKTFDEASRRGPWSLIASPDGRGGAVGSGWTLGGRGERNNEADHRQCRWPRGPHPSRFHLHHARLEQDGRLRPDRGDDGLQGPADGASAPRDHDRDRVRRRDPARHRLPGALGGARIRALARAGHPAIPQVLGNSRRPGHEPEHQFLQERRDPGWDADGVRLRAGPLQRGQAMTKA